MTDKLTDLVMSVISGLWQGMSETTPDDAPTPKFKIGDSVMVIKGKYVGARGTIDTSLFYSGWWFYHMITHDGSLGGGLFCREDAFRLIEMHS